MIGNEYYRMADSTMILTLPLFLVLIQEHNLSRCRDNIKEMLDSLEKIMDDIVKDLQTFRKQSELRCVYKHGHC